MLFLFKLLEGHLPCLLQTAITQASNRGVLVVCSAGNDGQNTDTTAHYPSSLPDDIILSVGASVATTDAIWYRPPPSNELPLFALLQHH